MDDTEIFVVYYGGVPLQLKWTCVPALIRAPAIRLCCISNKNKNTNSEDSELLLLLTADNCLYKATLVDNKASLLLELQRNDVVDLDYCHGSGELYIVTLKGTVENQHCGNTTYNTNGWQTLTFDPLELSEEGIQVRKVCCSAHGVLFVTQRDETYVLGSCGEMFNVEAQPIKMRLFEEDRELLDVTAGDDFFVMLVSNASSNTDKEDCKISIKNSHTSQSPAPAANAALYLKQTQLPHTSQTLTRQNTMELDFSLEDSTRMSDLISRTSIQSLSSKSDLSHIDSFAYNLQQIVNQGHNLLNTQVFTFGAVNNGLLGTGDHIKRATVNNVQKLDSIGICSISTGREHTVARTLDGRLFQWGLNSKQQLNTLATVTDFSAPTEIKLDSVDLDAHQRCVLEACCGDYETVLLNTAGALSTLPKKQTSSNFSKTFLNVQFGSEVSRPPNLRLLLVSHQFTLLNKRAFQTQYHNCLINLQAQMQLLLKYSHAIKLIRMYQKQTPVPALRTLQRVCINFIRLIYLLASVLHSIEAFYRADFENAADLLFVQFYRECIELFESYTKSYCDIYSIDGFAEAAKSFQKHSTVPLLADHNEESDLARIFQQPFQIFPVFIQFLEQLIKTRLEFKEHLTAWEVFGRQNCIYLELAVNTHEFWSTNERNQRIRQFRRKHRRVILTSNSVSLKLVNSPLSMSNPTFILFSDCLCQVGSTIYIYPLCTIWLKIEGDASLRVTTPEKSFLVTTKTHLDKMLWHDQLESSIVAALNRPVGSKAPNVRSTKYVFSRDHAKYAKVHAYGSWRNGELNGICYLEYPDGRVFYGELHHGEIEGFGKMMIPSVGLYEGNFKMGKFHGYGVFEMKDNEIYEGNFRDGLFHGHGMLRSNHYTYIGEYQANVKCGYGVLDDVDSGDKYMGMFAENKRNGVGTCITSKGDYFEGIFSGDELLGSGIAVLENDYYYEGDLSMYGPNGKGTYFMPCKSIKLDDLTANTIDECFNYELIGNVLSGNLSGNWQDVRIQSGSMSLNRQFSKYPKSIGELVVDNNRKWRSLFDNFETQILSLGTKNLDKNAITTEQLWSSISVFIHTLRSRQRAAEQQQDKSAASSSSRSYFASNIMLGLSNGFDKLGQKQGAIKSSIQNFYNDLLHPRSIHSLETLHNNGQISKSDSLHSVNVTTNCCDDEISVSSLRIDNSILNSTMTSVQSSSSFDSALNLSVDSNFTQQSTSNINNSTSSSNNKKSSSTQAALEYVPSFGINSLNENDVNSIKEYLEQAFKDSYHPLYLLNQQVANCFYYSYGCWKVKPTAILAKQAMHEWESISKRIYKFIRKMFPALPENFCIIESTREVVSHITLLYPIVLSEGIYSTLFVLYANKYSTKDEVYRQSLMCAEKLKDHELFDLLGLDSSSLAVINNEHFSDAVKSLRQLQERFSPKAMLTVIETCMQQITDAYKAAASEKAALLTADSMMPLTVFVVLRAAVPHLGAELALLDDLTGNANFEVEMNGLAGYCYTTLKASYELVTSKFLQKVQ